MIVHNYRRRWFEGFYELHKGMYVYCQEIANNACKGRSSAVFNQRPSIVNINNHVSTFNDVWDVGTVSYLLRGVLTQFLTVHFGRSYSKSKPAFSS